MRGTLSALEEEEEDGSEAEAMGDGVKIAPFSLLLTCFFLV